MTGRRSGCLLPSTLVLALTGAGCAVAPPRPPPATSAAARSPAAPPPAGAGPAGGKLATAPAAAAAPQATFEELLAREADGLTAHPVVFPGGRLTAEVESKAAPTVQRQVDSWEIAVPIGSEAPISCFVFDKPIDGGGSLLRFIHLARERAKGITVREVVPTDAGAIGETAFVMATMSYTKPTAGGLLGGRVKMIARPDADASLFCFHDEVGYSATFKRVTQGLARSLEARPPGPTPAFVEIQVTRVGDLSIGFDRRTITSEPHGLKIDQTVSCLLLPRGAGELGFTDHVVVERSDADGRVTGIESVESDGDELASQVSLTRQGSGREYRFTGKQSGKDISGSFKAKEKQGLPSALLVSERIRAQLLSGKSAEVKVEEYHADLSPQAPVEVSYRAAGAKAGTRDITLKLGHLEATGAVDERGMVQEVSMPIGATVMQLKRIFVRGTP